MKKIYTIQLLISALLLITSTLSAQKLYIGVGGGLGTFKMDKTREFNQTVMEYLPFDTKLTDDFPPYFLYKAEILYCFPKILSVGLNTTATSTGSRVCLSDYSGSYTFDNLQKAYMVGIKLMAGMFPAKKNGICFSVEGGMAMSFLSLKENIAVYNETENTITKCNSTGFYLQPGIDFYWHIVPRIMIGGNLSYFKGFNTNYHLKGDKEQTLHNTITNEPVGPQWDGIRASIVLYYQFLNFN
jgi:hypothetical protein